MAITVPVDTGKALAFGEISPRQKFRITGRLGLLIIAGLAIAFFFTAAAKYFVWDQQHYGLYWPYRGWILPHVIGGSIALLIGPLQFWTGLRRRQMTFHRWTGRLYLTGVTLGVVAGFYMAFHSVIGWQFGAGLFALGVVWTITTGMAYVAIRRGAVIAHKEWMIRSYMVTFTFVSFRLLTYSPVLRHTGTRPERLATLLWLSWTIPLIVCEAVFQWRRFRAGQQ